MLQLHHRAFFSRINLCLLNPGRPAMFNFTDPQTFWLNVTNSILGIVTLVCLIAVSVSAVKELVERLRAPQTEDDHSLYVGDLGLTMADGGKPVDEKSDDNVYLSEN
jgi:hypothetical protein